MISFKGKGMCDIVSIVCCLARCHHVRLTEHVTELWLILPADGHVSLLFHLTNSSVQETWHFVRWLQLYCTHDFKRPWGYEAVNHCQMFSILKVFYRPRQSADYYGKNVTCTNAKWGVFWFWSFEFAEFRKNYDCPKTLLMCLKTSSSFILILETVLILS